ncbi:MAG: hypothetical protein ABI564_16905, partial [Ideonella sp.]
RLIDSLQPNGMLIYETFNIDHASIGKPSNPAFLLRNGELLERCVSLRTLAYEDGFAANPDRFIQRIAAAAFCDAAANSTGGVSAQVRRYPL